MADVLGLVLDTAGLVIVKKLSATNFQSASVRGRTRTLGMALCCNAILMIIVDRLSTFLSGSLKANTNTHISILEVNRLRFAGILILIASCQLLLKFGVIETTIAILLLVSQLGNIMMLANGTVIWASFRYPRFLIATSAILVFSLLVLDSHLRARKDARGLCGPKAGAKLLICSVLGIVCTAQFYMGYKQQVLLDPHPFSLYMESAKSQQSQLDSTLWPRNLKAAVLTYRETNHISPPPGFDAWWQFASERNSVFSSDFANIEEDLLPFWSLDPAEIRLSTAEDCVQENNGIGCITIRRGNASVATNVPGSHRWMLDGMVKMIENFVTWLPDMDLAFNLNDESRVTLSYADGVSLTTNAKINRAKHQGPLQGFSTSESTSAKWPGIEVSRYPDEIQFQAIFDTYGVAHCHPASLSRRTSLWRHGELCLDCISFDAKQYGLFPFADKASETFDVCNQPDLAFLHGFYAAPSTFRGVRTLRATFSQSQAPGFLDIRYPGPWNYLDRDGSVYKPSDAFPDVPFEEKENTLFWRGTTTEGFAPGDGRSVWQGMGRQRFTAHVNFAAEQKILVPTSYAEDNDVTKTSSKSLPLLWSYTAFSPRQVGTYLSTNVSLLHPISRCRDADCEDQVAFFNRSSTTALTGVTQHVPLTSVPAPFQSSWRYKYLFDMDGAGASGRFISFAKSNCLVFKATSIFREWWTGRLTPWIHYVPVDPRLVGLHSTLAYFAGLNGKAGKGPLWNGDQLAAKRIAEEGAARARRVLRKEDMEVYMFRLLLEWGRLVDDDRYTLGYDVDQDSQS